MIDTDEIVGLRDGFVENLNSDTAQLQMFLEGAFYARFGP